MPNAKRTCHVGGLRFSIGASGKRNVHPSSPHIDHREGWPTQGLGYKKSLWGEKVFAYQVEAAHALRRNTWAKLVRWSYRELDFFGDVGDQNVEHMLGCVV
jgi:hypothetical protein